MSNTKLDKLKKCNGKHIDLNELFECDSCKILFNNKKKKIKIKTLICCCCGSYTKGRQWWNRDNGYGICGDCIKRFKERGESAEDLKSCYGEEGVHYNIK